MVVYVKPYSCKLNKTERRTYVCWGSQTFSI